MKPHHLSTRGRFPGIVPANAVHLPDELVILIDSAMEKAGGYSSRAEFVRECVRQKAFLIIETPRKKEKRKDRWP